MTEVIDPSLTPLKSLAQGPASQRAPILAPKPQSFSFLQSTGSSVTTYHLQRALPGGIILMELAFQVNRQSTM